MKTKTKQASVYVVRRTPTDEKKNQPGFQPRVDLAIEDRKLVEQLFGAAKVEEVFKATADRDAHRCETGAALKKVGHTCLGRFNLLFNGEVIQLIPAAAGEPSLFRAFCNPDYLHAHEAGAGQDQSKWGCVIHADSKPLSTFLYEFGMKLGNWNRRAAEIVGGRLIFHPATVIPISGEKKAFTRSGNGSKSADTDVVLI